MKPDVSIQFEIREALSQHLPIVDESQAAERLAFVSAILQPAIDDAYIVSMRGLASQGNTRALNSVYGAFVQQLDLYQFVDTVIGE